MSDLEYEIIVYPEEGGIVTAQFVRAYERCVDFLGEKTCGPYLEISFQAIPTYGYEFIGWERLYGDPTREEAIEYAINDFEGLNSEDHLILSDISCHHKLTLLAVFEEIQE